jgi:hypothetical protein
MYERAHVNQNNALCSQRIGSNLTQQGNTPLKGCSLAACRQRFSHDHLSLAGCPSLLHFCGRAGSSSEGQIWG